MQPNSEDEVNRLVIAVFQLNGVLIAAGDQITAPLGTTSARWQVLGALAFHDTALTVPRIAKYMGLSRQAVTKQMKLLVNEGFVQNKVNDAHKRADLWSLTAIGQEKYERIMAAQGKLAQQWRTSLSLTEIRDCTRILQVFQTSIQQAFDFCETALHTIKPPTQKAMQ